ncbi:MAG: hypothetical protein AB7I27_00690 [Bacteriovoracaceae bacterium]
MKTKASILVLSVFASSLIQAQDYYPFKPLPTQEIVSKIKYLAEDEAPLANLFEIHKRGLSQANTANAPWSGPYWPLKQGMIANAYMERSIFSLLNFVPGLDDIKPYDSRRDDILLNIMRFSNKDLSKLAPSEKYDLLLGTNMDLSNRVWDFINHWKHDMKWDYITSIDMPSEEYKIKKENYIIANWEGICHGWAPASGIVAKPSKTVNITLPDGRILPFFPEDIKGLVSLMWANSLVQDEVLSEGLRCKRRNPKKDQYGRYYDTIEENGKVLPRCADIHPAVLHMTLANVTGKQGRSFIVDKASTIAVSNQPVAGYKFNYFHPRNGETKNFNEALVNYELYKKDDPFANARNPETKYVIGVETILSYADWTMIKKPSSKDYNKDVYKNTTFNYDLELDANGNIIGGQWRTMRDPYDALTNPLEEKNPNYSNSTNQPDFLWIIPKNYKKHFKPISGLENWDITSGQPAPKSWTNAAISAHSFEYLAAKKFNRAETCKIENKSTGEVIETLCEFKYPKPQPLIQVVDQLVELSK